MEKLYVCFVSALLWNVAYSQSRCKTPMGATSTCIGLYDCPQILAAFSQRPLPNRVTSFLQQSQCGFDGNVPRVCCGPVPADNNYVPSTPTNSNNVKTNNISPDQLDAANSEDSSPAPRNSCGVETNGDRIYGGTATELDEFPWMALMGYRQRNGGITYQCGGVLINQRYVLTAAHCITGQIETQIGKLETIRLGEYDKRTDVDCVDGTCADSPQNIPVHIAIAHPGYLDNNKNRNDDIGIARLARRARYNYYVNPICLVSGNERVDVGNEVFVAGWGKTLSGKNSDVKEKLAIPVFAKEECVNKYSRLGAAITDKQICAGGQFAADTCRGDSGGPLMRKRPEGIWESLAVVSFGHGCGMDGWPGVYTSVAHYIDWIGSTMRSTNVYDDREIYACYSDDCEIYACYSDDREIYACYSDDREIYACYSDDREIYDCYSDDCEIYACNSNDREIYASYSDVHKVYPVLGAGKSVTANIDSHENSMFMPPCYHCKAEFSDSVSSCKDYENKNMLANLDLSEGDNGLMGLAGTIKIEQALDEDIMINIDIFRNTDTGKEPCFAVAMSLCDAIKDQDAPWWPLFDAVGITGCPIDMGTYDCQDMQIDLSSMDEYITPDYLGYYSVEVVLANSKKQALSCHEMAMRIFEP